MAPQLTRFGDPVEQSQNQRLNRFGDPVEESPKNPIVDFAQQFGGTLLEQEEWGKLAGKPPLWQFLLGVQPQE